MGHSADHGGTLDAPGHVSSLEDPDRPMTSTWSWPGVRSWFVHGYTATGAVLALLIVLAAVDGDVARALWLGLAALVIDGTDGMLARKVGVKERLPWFDGALLDNIVDYLTYVFAPVVLLLQTGYLPERHDGHGRRGAAARGVELPVLPGRRQDRRPLLPGVPELLERRRLLRDRPGPVVGRRRRRSSSSARCWCSSPSATSTRRG